MYIRISAHCSKERNENEQACVITKLDEGGVTNKRDTTKPTLFTFTGFVYVARLLHAQRYAHVVIKLVLIVRKSEFLYRSFSSRYFFGYFFFFVFPRRLGATVVRSSDQFTNELNPRLSGYYTLVHVWTIATILRGIRNLM